jgi:hypothetical protein
MMSEARVICDRCGAQSAVLQTDGLLIPDPRWPEARIVLTIQCPNCGEREQPGTVPLC